MKPMNKKNYENVKTVKTNYRKLENFLYLFGIAPLKTAKDWDGSTYWEYEDTPQLQLAVAGFRQIDDGLKKLNNHE